MKRFTAMLVIIICIGFLTGCGCSHEWKEATCEAPKICTLCQETEGEPFAHNWQDASCAAPKTCSGCGMTEGEALTHNWRDADCETPKTCSGCGMTEGEALGHQWGAAASCKEEILCTVCSAGSGEFGPHMELSHMNTADDEVHIRCQCGGEELLSDEELMLRMLKGTWTLMAVQQDGNYYAPEPQTNWEESTWMEFPSSTEPYGYQAGITDQVHFVIQHDLSDFQAGGARFTSNGNAVPIVQCSALPVSQDTTVEPVILRVVLGIRDYDPESFDAKTFIEASLNGYIACLWRYTKNINYLYAYNPDFTP